MLKPDYAHLIEHKEKPRDTDGICESVDDPRFARARCTFYHAFAAQYLVPVSEIHLGKYSLKVYKKSPGLTEGL